MSGVVAGPWALITGACGGIGTALVDRFKEDGFRVIGTDLDGPCEGSDHFLPCDLRTLVRQSQAREAFCNKVQEVIGNQGLSALVNNAAIQLLGSVRELSPDDLTSTFDVNVFAPFLLVQAFLDDLVVGSGSVVNISSVHARLTKPEFVAYASSKAALSGLTRAMGVDLGARVRVNAIAPAAIETPMLAAGFEGAPELQSRLAALHPVRRIGTAEEVADFTLFLVSDKARFINGAVYELDGGIGARLHDLR